MNNYPGALSRINRGIRHISLLTIFLLLVSGCIGPKRTDRWIAEKYGTTTQLNKTRADYYTVASPLVTADTKTSQSVKNGTKTVPLLFYWRFDYSITSTLNPKIAINVFSNAFTVYANSKQLRQKLNGRGLEMVIEKLPLSFTFHDDFRDINLFLAQIHWEKIYLVPEAAEMKIRYVISGTEKKSDVITIPDNNKLKQTRWFQKMSTAYSEYLTQYEDNIKAMARTVVDKLISEL
jgi:hypothetical protein